MLDNMYFLGTKEWEWQIWVEAGKVGGTILEDCSGSWLSRDVGEQFPRLAQHSLNRICAGKEDDAICWVCVCSACVSGRF